MELLLFSKSLHNVKEEYNNELYYYGDPTNEWAVSTTWHDLKWPSITNYESEHGYLFLFLLVWNSIIINFSTI